MRKTKIVCTIGPGCDNEETLREMCLAGMDVARCNFSHGDYAYHKQNFDRIKKVRSELKLPVALLLDTKGPEVRIGTFENGKIELAPGDTFTFTTEDCVGDQNHVKIKYPALTKSLKIGDIILLNDGLMDIEVTEIGENSVTGKVIHGGALSNNKSVHFPGVTLDIEFLSKKDKEDLLFGIENGIDFVAASFVSTKENMVEMRKFLDDNGGKDINIIAKIENQAGITNIDGICEIADGIMVARGDLGVEIPYAEIPGVQKLLIEKCRLLGKRVIVATEMLETMTHNLRPTRAEISDVANAVFDGTSAVMLSGETAAGDYPVNVVKTMADIVVKAEDKIDYKKIFKQTDFSICNRLDALSHSACQMAIDLGAKCICVNSVSGLTCRMVSRFRTAIPIVGLTTDEKIWRQLNLSWGVIPALNELYPSEEVMYYESLRLAKSILSLNPEDNVIMTGGRINGNHGNSNTIRVETVQ